MVSLYMGGGEINAFGELLESMDVQHIAVSFMGLRRRIKHLDKVNLAQRFSEDARILLDSGCYGINSAPSQQYTDDELKQIADEYDQFVDRHRDYLGWWTEFDALQLGAEWIAGRRTNTLSEIQVWHEEDGLEALQGMIERDVTIGVTGTSLGDRDLTPILGNAARNEHYVFGLGMTKPAQMAEIPWTGVTSTSWLSPVKFRDLIVWSGGELKRYPKKNREQAKKRHRTLFRTVGFDPDLIDADDNNELLRLSIWSWQQQLADINGTPAPDLATKSANSLPDENAELLGAEVDNSPSRPAELNPLGVGVRQRPKRLLPGLEVAEHTEPYFDADGTRQERKRPILGTTSDTLLQCSSCYLAGKCPAFEPGAACVYDIPVQIRTKEQLASVQAALMEMQVRRVMYMHMAEQVEGGYADPNLSGELDRLNRMIKTKHELDAEGFSLTIKANQTASATGAEMGALSRIFGERATTPVRALPAPVSSVTAAQQLGLIEDAEVLEEVHHAA